MWVVMSSREGCRRLHRRRGVCTSRTDLIFSHNGILYQERTTWTRSVGTKNQSSRRTGPWSGTKDQGRLGLLGGRWTVDGQRGFHQRSAGSPPLSAASSRQYSFSSGRSQRKRSAIEAGPCIHFQSSITALITLSFSFSALTIISPISSSLKVSVISGFTFTAPLFIISMHLGK